MNRSKNDEIISLARELIDDIELSRLSSESLLLKATRLARLAGSTTTQRWLEFEMVGYNSMDPVALEYMGWTGRWTDQKKQWGFWGSLAQQEAEITALKLRLQTLRIPDINYSVSSSNPNEFVNPSTGLGSISPTGLVSNILQESGNLATRLAQVSGIRSKVLALLHHFAANIYHQRVFSGLAETLFERYQNELDRLLADQCGDVLERIPSVYDRLAAGDRESVSQALGTCRRIIDSFADSVYPSTDTTMDIDGQTIRLGPQHHQNRINAYIRRCVSSRSRQKKLRQALSNLYERVSAGVHSDVTHEEAQSLFLETYLLLGQILTSHEPTSEDQTANLDR